MINLRAFSGKEELDLKSGKDVVVHFPKNGSDKAMNLFYGKEDYKGNVDWELEEKSTYRIKNNIVIWYTKYDDLNEDTGNLIDGSSPYWITDKHFDFTEKEIEYLLNKTVHAHYILFDDGEMQFVEMRGSKIKKSLENKIIQKVKTFPQCKPYTREGVPIDMPGHFKIWSEVIPPKYQSNKDYLKSIESKMNKKGSTKGLKLAELQYYIFDSKKLGWMNCDLFIEQGKEIIDYLVKVPESKNVFTKIIFRDYKTVMTGDQEKNIFKFETFPLNEPIKVVVIDEKKGKPYLEIIDTIVTSEILEVKKLNQYSLSEMKEKLKELD